MAMTTDPDPEDEPGSDALIETYPEAPDSLVAHWMRRRQPMLLATDDQFPGADIDLQALLATRIPKDIPPLAGQQTRHGEKLHAMRVELAGKPELAVVNAILIAHLRKEGFPDHAPALFRRIWLEAGQTLMQELPNRWLISSTITFGDHGETEAQRRIGLAINVLFSLIKLYEFERFHSGFAPDCPFPERRTRRKRLPLDMPHFKLASGGLDINLMAQIWSEARREPVVGPLACHLLQKLNEDPGNLFRRIGIMRGGKRLDRMGQLLAGGLASPDTESSEDDGTT